MNDQLAYIKNAVGYNDKEFDVNLYVNDIRARGTSLSWGGLHFDDDWEIQCDCCYDLMEEEFEDWWYGYDNKTELYLCCDCYAVLMHPIANDYDLLKLMKEHQG